MHAHTGQTIADCSVQEQHRDLHVTAVGSGQSPFSTEQIFSTVSNAHSPQDLAAQYLTERFDDPNSKWRVQG